MKRINLKKLIFDYHTPIDYNPFGGEFKREGFWVLNKQKLINLVLVVGLLLLAFYIFCCI